MQSNSKILSMVFFISIWFAIACGIQSFCLYNVVVYLQSNFNVAKVHARSLRPSHPTGVGIQQGLFSKKNFTILKWPLWKGFNCRQITRWQYLSRLKASAFFSLLKKLVVMKHSNLYSGLVLPSGG